MCHHNMWVSGGCQGIVLVTLVNNTDQTINPKTQENGLPQLYNRLTSMYRLCMGMMFPIKSSCGFTTNRYMTHLSKCYIQNLYSQQRTFSQHSYEKVLF